MLGRQQIAGIPTAISELFKNAHDAYANEAVADFLRARDTFVLRDDGTGMTRAEFEEQWLTLGTESKLADSSGASRVTPRSGYEARAVLGEKGIGRLAIAAIGPQVLVLTRSLGEDGLGELTSAFIHWGLFELPGVNVDEIEIPIVGLSTGEVPDAALTQDLVSRVRANLLSLRAPQADMVKRIEAELDSFNVSPAELAPILGQPDLRNVSGTQFYIKPASPMLAHSLDEASRSDAGDLRQALVGFANTMTPGHSPPALSISFRDHVTEDSWVDVIAEGEFFTPDEFLAADHRIQGRFDEWGEFAGSVQVYGGDPSPYRVPWRRGGGQSITCGPFDFDLAYIQGRQQQSRLEPSLYSQISAKLDWYGGLYVYRDGVRVLPYGNNDVDWLDIEVQRAKSASDAFFSYRRMFGAIELTRQENSDLREKAGREGFADNEAYRQFRAILKAFFYQVAVDFFRDTGAHAEEWQARRTELERLDKARRRREGQVGERRRALSRELANFFDRLEDARPQEDVDQVLRMLEGQLKTAVSTADAAKIAAAEEAARSALAALLQSYEVRRPRGVGLPRALARTASAYEDEFSNLRSTIFVPAAAAVERMVEAAGDGTGLQRRLRFDRAIEVASQRATEAIRGQRRDLRETTTATMQRSNELSRSAVTAVESAIADLRSKAARTNVAKLAEKEYVDLRSELEEELEAVLDSHAEALRTVTEQLRGLVWPTNGVGPLVTSLDEVEAIETELEGFRERAAQDLELTQIGMAVEVVDHEFRRSILGIRRALQRLKTWADSNRRLQEPYEDLRANFEHLDGYLKLLTPLHRRLYRKKVQITGRQLERFLRDLFRQRLEADRVELVATPSFRELAFLHYPSTIYPVFINLVDNALWWLTDFRGERKVTLDAGRRWMAVRDSGPGVSPRDAESIFDLGFSRKPGGSGYGLYISREVLAREGMSLDLARQGVDAGAEFRISPIPVSTDG